MYCIYCGKEIADDSAFCQYCGKEANDAAPVSERRETPAVIRGILTNGIVAAAISSFGIPGIIAGAIGRSKVKKYLASDGRPSTQVKIGSILSKVGIGVGIGMTVLFTLYFAMVFMLILAHRY